MQEMPMTVSRILYTFTRSYLEGEQNKNPELQQDQHVTEWTASWVNVNDWARFDGHYLFLEDTKGVISIVNRRRTDNTMVKRKRTKGQTTIYKTHT
jgi:hypothetical protein